MPSIRQTIKSQGGALVPPKTNDEERAKEKPSAYNKRSAAIFVGTPFFMPCSA